MKKHKPNSKKFKASNRWKLNFCRRYMVSTRKTTNTKTKSAQSRLPQVRKFHRTVKIFCQPPPARHHKYGRFPAKNRYHVDQVPLEFGGVFDSTLADKGSKTVHVKTPKKDMGRRRASLQLCFRADGPQNCKPGICFRLTPKKSRNGSVDPKTPSTCTLKEEREKMPRGMHEYFQ